MISAANKKLLRIGGPFITLIVVGSYGLTYFTEIRYWVSRNKKRFASIPVDGSSRKVKTLSEIYQEEIAGKDFDNWENIRAPRPWEPETITANQEKAQKVRQDRVRELFRKIEESAAAEPKTSQ